MNLRQMLSLEPGFDAQPLGPALPRLVKPPLGKPLTFLASGVVVDGNTGKMRTAFVRGEHFSESRYGQRGLGPAAASKLAASGPDDAAAPYRAAADFLYFAKELAHIGWRRIPKSRELDSRVYQVLLPEGKIVRQLAGRAPDAAIAWREEQDAFGALRYTPPNWQSPGNVRLGEPLPKPRWIKMKDGAVFPWGDRHCCGYKPHDVVAWR